MSLVFAPARIRRAARTASGSFCQRGIGWTAFLAALDDTQLLAQQQDFEIFVAVLGVAQHENVEEKREEKSQEGIGHPAIISLDYSAQT